MSGEERMRWIRTRGWARRVLRAQDRRDAALPENTEAFTEKQAAKLLNLRTKIRTGVLTGDTAPAEEE